MARELVAVKLPLLTLNRDCPAGDVNAAPRFSPLATDTFPPLTVKRGPLRLKVDPEARSSRSPLVALRVPAEAKNTLPLEGPVTVLATLRTSPLIVTVGVPLDMLRSDPPRVMVPPLTLTRSVPVPVMVSVPPLRSNTEVAPLVSVLDPTIKASAPALTVPPL